MSFHRELAAYFELAKPRITTLLLIVALASYAIAAGPAFQWFGFAVVFASVGALGSGIFALNHYLERDQDRLMLRTRERPLPSGRIPPWAALGFGLSFTALGIGVSFGLANAVTGWVAVFVAVSYLLIYTPLKYKTAFHTALGALPGAAPPLAGWAVATGQLDLQAWVLFGVLFLWQFPHFLSIEMIYREDYAKAGIRVLPVVDPSGRQVAWQVLTAQILLLAVTVVPPLAGMGGRVTLIGCVLLGIGFLLVGIRAVRTRQKMAAKHLLRASVLYLPLVFLLLFFQP